MFDPECVVLAGHYIEEDPAYIRGPAVAGMPELTAKG